jgi:hypothetical protein
LRRNGPLRHVVKGKIWEGQKRQKDKKEDVSRYWMTFRKREDSEI